MIGRRRDRRTETYTTSDWDDGKEDKPPKDPVVAVRVLPKGQTHVLADFRDCYGSKKWITIGSSSLADIRLFERLGKRPRVSREHCELCRTPSNRWLIRRHPNAHNSTKVNRTRVRGFVELAPGDVIRAGTIQLVALSASGLDRIKVTADDPDDYVDRVVKTRGSTRAAAPLFGVHFSTVARWIKKLRR